MFASWKNVVTNSKGLPPPKIWQGRKAPGGVMMSDDTERRGGSFSRSRENGRGSYLGARSELFLLYDYLGNTRKLRKTTVSSQALASFAIHALHIHLRLKQRTTI
eukprot:scaffold426_cov219-Amphora_coffeaeformis.AAC.5